MFKKTSDIGLVGLGVMGSALARNIADKGYSVSVYNREFDITKTFLEEYNTLPITGAKNYKQLVKSIARPRKIMLMITAGPAVDAVIASLKPYLQKGDIIIDGGNSHYRDTQRRYIELQKKGIDFVGCGVSGGEDGALHGPSIMPGGSKDAWKAVRPFMEAIAAKDFMGGPCVSYVGSNGAGHYVKMVHNGIEYGIMQLIAESYDMLHKGYGMGAREIGKVFQEFNNGKLRSFLMEIAVPVLKKGCKKKDAGCLIYKVLDSAGSKGTGLWTSLDALERGIAVPSIIQAVQARHVSTEKQERTRLEKIYPHTHKKPTLAKKTFISLLEDALYMAMISIFAQGYDIIQKASKEEKWGIDMAEVSRIWQGGCIIRADLLDMLYKGYKKDKATYKHLFAIKAVSPILTKDTARLAKLVSVSAQSRIPLPGFSSALYYIESMTEARLPANIIQGLRDYFGAHTYQRIDKKGIFHTNWKQ